MNPEIPKIIEELNKAKKTIKISTLAKAKSFYIKRFPSGSFAIDNLVGGGYAFRRMHMLFGQKSSGKNSHLYQTIAFNQRICRHCGGILPGYVQEETSSHIISGKDRWATILLDYMGTPICDCAKSTGRVFLFYDYEKTLGLESAKSKIVRHVTDTKTGDIIPEETYETAEQFLIDMTKAEVELTPELKAQIKEQEKFIKNCSVETQVIPMLASTDYLQACGVDTDRLLVSDPDGAEECINDLTKIIPSREVDAVIVDSLQTMLPKHVKERDAEDATMGVEARMNGLMVKQICSAYTAANIEDEAEAYKPALFFISQVRSKLGGFVVGQPSFSGGFAIEHAMSLILELKREKFLKADGSDASFKEEYYGQLVRVRTEKNKLGTPGDFAEYAFYFKDGATFHMGEVDHVNEITDLGVAKGIIQRAGAFYKVNGESFQGKLSLLTYMRENPKFVGEVFKIARG